jgi:4-diphosphocytidyl-2-C-methyl-D-erythritol kinase
VVKRRRQAVPRVVIEARAKLNLGLLVGPRRADGYHDLVTVFQSIDLADTLIIEPRARGFTLAVRFENASLSGGAAPRPAGHDVPRGADNLVLRAARQVAAELALNAGAHFTLIKRIPAAAGLGGGSADAAAVLHGLPVLFGLRLLPRRRQAIALALGSDVPFACIGGTAIGAGRGERLHRTRLARPFRAILAVPDWRVSTAQAFAGIDRRKLGLTARRLTLVSGQLFGRERLSATTCVRLGNTFERVLGRRRREFRGLRERMRRTGLTEVRMTGSGSAVFGILGPDLPAHHVVRRFTGSEPLYMVRSTGSGVRRRHGTP